MHEENEREIIDLGARKNPVLYYLASPYGSENPIIQHHRRREATIATEMLLNTDMQVFSPIVYSTALKDGVLSDWYGIDLVLLAHCDALLVLCLHGWRESVGVQKEIEFAESRNMPIAYLSVKKGQMMFTAEPDGGADEGRWNSSMAYMMHCVVDEMEEQAWLESEGVLDDTEE